MDKRFPQQLFLYRNVLQDHLDYFVNHLKFPATMGSRTIQLYQNEHFVLVDHHKISEHHHYPHRDLCES